MVHRKRNHPGIVHGSTALDGLNFWDVPQIAAYREKLISCQKGSDLALTRKLADGTYLAYFPFASLTEESKMTPYHKKLKIGLDNTKHNISYQTSNNDIKELSTKECMEYSAILARDDIFETGIHSYADK